MDMRQYAVTTFIKVDHVRDGPLRLKISEVKQGKYDKPDVYFATGEVLSLNGTNAATLIREFGPDSDDWIDKEVELKLGKIKYQGELQEAVIVEPITRLTAAEKKKAVAKMDDEIPF